MTGTLALLSIGSVFGDFWQDQIIDEEKQGIFLVLTGFVLSFAFIRMSTRLMRSPKVPWWPGSIVSESGVHLHHLVFGIVTMMISGTVGFTALGASPTTEICAFLFGVGVGLTIDEFALWVYLDDVYWAEEGRLSIDATVIAAALMGLVLLGFTPFSLDTDTTAKMVVSLASGLILFLIVAICFGKQRLLHGIIGFFVLPVAIYGACRVAKPNSPWARRRYAKRPEKMAKAEARFKPGRRTDRFKDAFRDIVGGKPSEGVAAVTQEALGATRQAAEEVRQHADRITHPTRDKE